MKSKFNICTLSLIFAASFLTACSFEPHARTEAFPVLPDDLKDCKFYNISNGNTMLHVVRCPNSSVSTQTSGKNPQNIIVIDGVSYSPNITASSLPIKILR